MFAIHQEIVTHRLARIDGSMNPGEAIGEISILHGGDFSRLRRRYQTRFFELKIPAKGEGVESAILKLKLICGAGEIGQKPIPPAQNRSATRWEYKYTR